jgi:hypothetical protein
MTLAIACLLAATGLFQGFAQQNPPAPAVPPPASPPASSPPAGPASGPASATGQAATVEVDTDCLKAAIKQVTEAVLHAAKLRNEDQKMADQARYDKAKAEWDAKRKERNDDIGDDAERDEHAARRRRGNKPPPAPNRSDFNSPTWADLMQEERKQERRLDPKAGKKERPLIDPKSPLNVKPLQDFVKDWREKVTDKRIVGMLKDIEQAYAKAVAEKSAATP